MHLHILPLVIHRFLAIPAKCLWCSRQNCHRWFTVLTQHGKNPNWQVAASWLFYKRGRGVELGTTAREQIQLGAGGCVLLWNFYSKFSFCPLDPSWSNRLPGGGCYWSTRCWKIYCSLCSGGSWAFHWLKVCDSSGCCFTLVSISCND